MDADQDVAKSALDQLLNVSPDLIKSLTLPHLMQTLESLGLESEETDEEFRLVRADWVLQCVETLATRSPELAADAIKEELRILKRKLDHLHTRDELATLDLEFCASLISSLTVLARITTEGDTWTLLVVPIFQDAFKSSASKSASGSLYMNHAYLELIANLVGTIVQSLDKNEQQKAFKQTMDVFQLGNSEDLGINLTVQPLDPKSPPEQTNLSCLFSAVLCHCNKDVLSVSNLADWLKGASTTTDAILSRSLSQASATIVNKTLSDAQTQELIDGLQEEIASESSLTMWSWLARATALKCHASAPVIVRQILDAFAGPLGMKAAESMQVVMSDSDACLGKGNANVKLLYKQKLLQATLPLLIKGFAESQGETRHCHLVALSIMLANVPKTLLLSHAQQILPLLLESLHVTDAQLKTSTLTLFGMLVREVPAMMGEHAESLVRELLELCKASPMSEPVRLHPRRLTFFSESGVRHCSV